MAKMYLRAILPQIHHLFTGGQTGGLSDGVLLSRYRATRDEDAFSTLVARHGPMVLGVCGSIVHDEIQAEDAFQAVFLILVQKANAIRVDDSLGGWLHEVAYRVSKHLSVDTARRNTREQRMGALFDMQVRVTSQLHPQLAQLHEEIARLPVALRQALVLCLLEGKTQVEAAQEIGCGEATVRRRLSAARDRLQKRLKTDPDESGQLVAPLAALSPHLLQSTTQVAKGMLTPLAAAVLKEMTGGQVMKVVVLMILFGLTIAGATVALGSRPEAPAAPPAPSQQPRGVDAVAAVPAQDPEPDPIARLIPDEDDIESHPEKWGQVDIVGRVLDANSNPVPNAVIYRRDRRMLAPERKAVTGADGRFRFQTKRKLGPRKSANMPGPQPKVTTLPDGSTLTVLESPDRRGAPHTDEDEIKQARPWLLAVAPGHGFGTPESGDGLTIKLAPEEPIRGRLIGPDGKPVAGARIRVRNVNWPRCKGDPLMELEDDRVTWQPREIPPGDGLSAWLEEVKNAGEVNAYLRSLGMFISLIDYGRLGDRPSVYAPLIPAVTSNAEGTFTLLGVGKNRMVELYIDGFPNLASELITVVTRRLDDPIHVSMYSEETRKLVVNPRPDLVVYGSTFECKLQRGRTIEGVIIDKTTGKPVEGAKFLSRDVSTVEYPGFDRFFTTTDKAGRFRIESYPLRDNAFFQVEPPKKQPYFGSNLTLEIKPSDEPMQVSIKLAKGVWITGRIYDEATGKGDWGGSAEYHAFRDNPYLKADLKDGVHPAFDDDSHAESNGTFRIRGYPGRGIVSGGGGDEYLYGVGFEKIKGLKQDDNSESLYDALGFNVCLRNTTVEVNIPEGVDEFKCDIPLRKGKSRLVHVIGPDGQPRNRIEASGVGNQIQNPMEEIEQSSFNVTNLYPGERREVVARYVPNKWTGMAVVTEEGDEPVTLKLQPWATLTGRLVDDAGKPLFRGLQIMLEDYKLPLHTLNGHEYDKEQFAIEPDRRFKLEGLVPGAKYRLEVLKESVQVLGDLTDDFTLNPGENRDLGDVRIKKSKD